MHERIEKFEDILEKDLKEELDKIINAGTVSTESVKTVNEAVCLMLKLKEYEDWDEGYSNRSYNRGSRNSYRRGRDANTGRYVSRDRMKPMMDAYEEGYSGHSIKDRMIDRLESMYDEAQTDHERQMVDEWINRLETEK